MTALRLVAGFVLGVLMTACALAAVSRARRPLIEEVPVEAPAPPARMIPIQDLRDEVAEREIRVANTNPAALGRSATAAAEYGKAVKETFGTAASLKAAKTVQHLLDRYRWEHLLSDEEMLILPLRDRLIPEFLEAAGVPLTEAQQAAFLAMLAFEEEAWSDRLTARAGEGALQRTAVALALAHRLESWRDSILDASQQSMLATRSGTEFVSIGPRRCPRGVEFATAGELEEEWSQELAAVVHADVREAARNYAGRAAGLGAPEDNGTGTVSLSWRLRQVALQREIQAQLLDHEDLTDAERYALRRWYPLYDLTPR